MSRTGAFISFPHSEAFKILLHSKTFLAQRHAFTQEFSNDILPLVPFTQKVKMEFFTMFVGAHPLFTEIVTERRTITLTHLHRYTFTLIMERFTLMATG